MNPDYGDNYRGVLAQNSCGSTIVSNSKIQSLNKNYIGNKASTILTQELINSQSDVATQDRVLNIQGNAFKDN